MQLPQAQYQKKIENKTNDQKENTPINDTQQTKNTNLGVGNNERKEEEEEDIYNDFDDDESNSYIINELASSHENDKNSPKEKKLGKNGGEGYDVSSENDSSLSVTEDEEKISFIQLLVHIIIQE